jgi:hypothetical protein
VHGQATYIIYSYIKFVDILIKPILTYNSEIWFMDDYLSISRAIFRSEQSGSVCDTLSLEDKFCFEDLIP